MNETPKPLTSQLTSRREFLKSTGQIAAASALAGVAIPYVHSAVDDTLQVALVGCGGRGTGAAANALGTTPLGPIKLTAMADVYQNRLDGSYNTLKRQNLGPLVDVPQDRKYIGFDAYKQAMDTLKPGDIAIFTTPLAFRWVHFTYAIQKGLNVFMEKPLTADGPTSRRMLGLAEQASAKNLKVGVGLMSRHSRALQELQKRIQDGEIGDVNLLRGYRMQGRLGSAFSQKWPGKTKPEDPSELLWQISRFHSFIWASGGGYSDFNIHHIDHLCWMKNAWPIKAQGIGGRHYRGNDVDQNFDSYSVEYTFADGAKLYMDGRCMVGAHPMYYSFAHGSKGMAVVSDHGDCGEPSRIYKGQNPDPANQLWISNVPGNQKDPYLNEWNSLVDAIRNNKPYSEVKRGVEASVVTSMGRMAAHTGQEITFEQMLNHEHEYAPGADKLTMDSPAPLLAGPDGKYPIPQPGIIKNREY
jgi:predicted dehydrogenase